MSGAGPASRSDEWDLLRAVSGPAGMPLQDLLASHGVSIISAIGDRHEHDFASLDEGLFDMSVTCRIDPSVWEEETGEKFGKDSFGKTMISPAISHPGQVGMTLHDFSLTMVSPTEATITLKAEVTDGIAAGAAATTLMRESGYGQEDVPPNPGEAVAEVWMMSNDAPTPIDVGVEYVSHLYQPGPEMRPARALPEIVTEDSPEP